MPRWLGFLTLAGVAAAAETVDACLSNLGPQQVDEVCGSDGVAYDSYAHALCHNAVDAAMAVIRSGVTRMGSMTQRRVNGRSIESTAGLRLGDRRLPGMLPGRGT